MTVEYNLTANQVNWLGNMVSLVFLPAALAVPFLTNKWGLKTTVSPIQPETLLLVTDSMLSA